MVFVLQMIGKYNVYEKKILLLQLYSSLYLLDNNSLLRKRWEKKPKRCIFLVLFFAIYLVVPFSFGVINSRETKWIQAGMKIDQSKYHKQSIVTLDKAVWVFREN